MFKNILFLLLTIKICCGDNLKLEQVLILSRHNVRTPLAKNLFEYSPKTWPAWKEKSGYLTEKGKLLEGFMGEFFSSWFIKEGLVNEVCPSDKWFYVYSNNAQRAMESAKAFVSKAFPLCNVTIHHSETQRDPIFNPVIHNTSEAFKAAALNQMQTLLKSLHLNSSYEDLEQILDYKDSKYCLVKHKCDFVKDKNKLFVNTGFKPNLEGPLKISKSVIDSFIMENYEGFPIDEVAWGTLQNSDQWDAILDLSRQYHNIIFNTTLVARDVAKPLLRFIKDLLLVRQQKVTLLMGHDANIYTVLSSMEFKPYMLHNQYEWPLQAVSLYSRNGKTKKLENSLQKLTMCTKVRSRCEAGTKLSTENPPEFTLLELKNCKINAQGLCPWDDFVNLLNGLL